jgi:hypothetical protein
MFTRHTSRRDRSPDDGLSSDYILSKLANPTVMTFNPVIQGQFCRVAGGLISVQQSMIIGRPSNPAVRGDRFQSGGETVKQMVNKLLRE